jgi:hypothetical protein
MPKHPGAVLLGKRGGRPPKSAKQAVARAQPKQTNPTGVVPHSGRPYVKRVDKAIQPNNNDRLGSARMTDTNMPSDTGARDTPAMNRKAQKKLGSPVKTKYATAKRTLLPR